MDAALRSSGFRIYRQIEGDLSSPVIWEPAEESDELHDVLRHKYPRSRYKHLKTHRERKKFALREFRLQELLREEQSARKKSALREVQCQELLREAREAGDMDGVLPATPEPRIEALSDGHRDCSVGPAQAIDGKIGSFHCVSQEYELQPRPEKRARLPALPYCNSSDGNSTTNAFVTQHEALPYEVNQTVSPLMVVGHIDPRLLSTDSSHSSSSQSSASPVPLIGHGSAPARRSYTRRKKLKDGYHCDDCNRSFDRQCDLNHHKRIHQTRSHNCDSCEKNFLYAKDLRRHMRRKHDQGTIAAATTHTIARGEEIHDPSQEALVEMGESMAGLNQAPETIHNLGEPVWHPDLSPRNILDTGTGAPVSLNIADLGSDNSRDIANENTGQTASSLMTTAFDTADDGSQPIFRGSLVSPDTGLTLVSVSSSLSSGPRAQDPDEQQRDDVQNPATNTLFAGIEAQRELMQPLAETETLYSSFRLRSPTYFSMGRVFLILWVEPAAKTGSPVISLDASDRTIGHAARRSHDELVYSRVRRFLKIREGDQYCSALPIISYRHQGSRKDGFRKSEHAIILTGNSSDGLGLSSASGHGNVRQNDARESGPIRVCPANPADKLDPVSRIDFGKLHPVQHNIKVRPFGEVHSSSVSTLKSQFERIYTNAASAERPSSTLKMKTNRNTIRPPVKASDGSAACYGPYPRIPPPPNPRDPGEHRALSNAGVVQQTAKLSNGTYSTHATGNPAYDNLAIIGRTGRLPRSAAPDEFWQLLASPPAHGTAGGQQFWSGRFASMPNPRFEVKARHQHVHRPLSGFFVPDRSPGGEDPQLRLYRVTVLEAIENAGFALDWTASQPRARATGSISDEDLIDDPRKLSHTVFDATSNFHHHSWRAVEATEASHQSAAALGHPWKFALALLTLILLGHRMICRIFTTHHRSPLCKVAPIIRSSSLSSSVRSGNFHSQARASMLWA